MKSLLLDRSHPKCREIAASGTSTDLGQATISTMKEVYRPRLPLITILMLA